MRMSKIVTAVAGAAAALSVISAPAANAGQDIIGGGTVSSAPWGAQIYWNDVTAFGGEAIASVGVNGSAWHGDSGGPQLSGGVQVGVCSTGENSGTNPKGTQNYASVASSRTWIRTTAGV